MRRNIFLLTVCLFAFATVTATAQTPPSQPPKVLQVFREDVKPGRAAAHEKVEIGYVQAFRDANWKSASLALTSISGASEALFISGYDSFDALEKDNQEIQKNPALAKAFERLDEQDSEFRTGQRGMIAVYVDELSYNPGVNLPQMRYFTINTVRVRPGHDEEWQEARKILLEGLRKAKVDSHAAAYRVVAGAPAGTYLIFTPRKSLAEMNPNPEREKALRDAMGEDNRKKRNKLLGDSVMVSENNIYAFSPRMSYVTEEFAKGDPAFWMPKPMVAGGRTQQRKKAAADATAKKQQ